MGSAVSVSLANWIIHFFLTIVNKMERFEDWRLTNFGLNFNLLKSTRFLSWNGFLFSLLIFIGSGYALPFITPLKEENYLRDVLIIVDFVKMVFYTGFMWHRCWKLVNFTKEKRMEDIGNTLKDIIIVSAYSKWVSTGFSVISSEKGYLGDFTVIMQIFFLQDGVKMENRGKLKWYLYYEYFFLIVSLSAAVISASSFMDIVLILLYSSSFIISSIYGFISVLGYVIVLDSLFYNNEVRKETTIYGARVEEVKKLPHNDEKSWLMHDVDRPKAEEMLQNKDHGTFLIRWSNKMQQYALSIKFHSEVAHCLIHNGAHGFGFSEPNNKRCKHPTLMELVLHYAVNSLERHNKNFKTNLKYPIGGSLPTHEIT